MNINYIDVTKEWLEDAISNSYDVKDLLFFIDECGNEYKVDGKNVVLDYSKKEKEIAIFISKKLGGIVYMVPKVNYPKNIKTPDYFWKNEKWDLKEINGESKRIIDNVVKSKKEQTSNFILDSSKSKLSTIELTEQIRHLFDSKSRKWINTIILIKNYKVIKILKRK